MKIENNEHALLKEVDAALNAPASGGVHTNDTTGGTGDGDTGDNYPKPGSK